MLPGQHEIEDDPGREQVRPRVGLRPAQLLGRRELGRREDHAGLGLDQLAALEQRDPEVGHLEASVVEDHEVRRLDVSVDDPCPMGRLERVEKGGRQLDGFADRQTLAVGEDFLQGAALEPLHGDEGLVAELAHLVDRGRTGMGEGRRRAGLLEETLPQLGAALSVRLRHGRAEGLDRHRPVEGGIEGFEDDAHRAAADPAADFVGEGVARAEGWIDHGGGVTGAMPAVLERRGRWATGQRDRCRKQRLHYTERA
jgi:hypothetical protein